MDDKHLSTEAIRKGYLTFDQMLECMKIQESARKEGMSLLLADILLRKGFLSQTQLSEITGVTHAMPATDATPKLPSDTSLERPVITEGGALFEVRTDSQLGVSTPETPEPEPAPITFTGIDFDSLLAEREKEISQKATESGWTDLPAAVGPYEVQGKLGQGEMGVVYLATKERHGPWALRVWPVSFAQDAPLVERFTKEAPVRTALNHPNLTRMVEYGTVNARYFSVTEYIEGKTLWEYVEAHGALPEREALRFALQIAQALQAVHKAGLLHRNLKPDRVIIDRESNAWLLEPGLKRPGVTVTGVSYMAPESNRAEPDLDARADLYSLGATLFYALTGLHPFSAPSTQESLRKQLEGETPNPKQSRSLLNPAVSDLVRKLMAKDKAQRPAGVEEVIPQIQKLLQDAPLPLQNIPIQTDPISAIRTRPDAPSTQYVRPRSDQMIIVGGVIILLVFIAMLILAFLR
jgi:serine/threonine-protein kinase